MVFFRQQESRADRREQLSNFYCAYVTCRELELINHPTSRPPFLNDYSIDSNFDLISSHVSKVTMFLSLKFRAY